MVEAETDSCALPSVPTTDEWFSYGGRGVLNAFWESTPHSGGYYYSAIAVWPSYVLNALSLSSSSGASLIPTQTYGVDGEGRTNSVTVASGQSPVTGATYVTTNGTGDPVGSLTNVTFGSQDSDVYHYDTNTGRMLKYTFNVNGQSASGTLGWNANGTLGTLAITDPFNSLDNQTCTYSYDALARLNGDNCGSVWNQTFAYDAFGNITKSGSISWQPAYNNPSNNKYLTGWSNVQYDANGNLKSDPYNTYTWDAFNDLATANGASVTYDAFSQMVENQGGIYQFVYSPTGGQPLAIMNGQTLVNAFVPLPVRGEYAIYNSFGLSQYNHPDWLGSARLSSSPSRSPIPSMSYAPFGEGYTGGQQWVQFTATGEAWTVQPGENDTGSLEDFTFRRYSPTQGRWISPDPAGLSATDPSNPQSWNRYAYVLNNPLGYTDPTGLVCYYGTTDDGGHPDFTLPDASDWNSWDNSKAGEEGRKECGDHQGVWYDNNSPDNPFAAGVTEQYLPDDTVSSSSAANNSSWGWNFTKAFFKNFSLRAVYHSFGEGGCDRLMAETFADVFNPLPGGDLGAGDAAELGPKAVARAGQAAASAYSVYQGLSVPLRSSIYRGLQSSTYGYAAALEEVAPYLQVGYAGGKALLVTSMAAYNGKCY